MKTWHLILLSVLLGLGWLAQAMWAGPAPLITVATDVQGHYTDRGEWQGTALPRNPNPPNLIIVVLDTLRADCTAPGKQMPALTRLAKQGTTVTNCASPAVWTFPALTSLLTGLHTSEHRVDNSPRGVFLPPTATTFTEVLGHGHGYETAAFLEVDLPSRHNTILQGFQTVLRRVPLRGTRQALRVWAERRDFDKPFFLFIHTYEAHTPYGQANRPWPERPYSPAASPYKGKNPLKQSDAKLVEALALDGLARKALLSGESRQAILDRTIAYRGVGWQRAPDLALAKRLRDAYRKGVEELDLELAKTVQSLRRLGLLDNTLLVVTSDHGEAFGEHGVLTHGLSVHDELTRIPLVLVGPPPFDGGRVLPTSMALHDVLPTYLDWAGLPPLQRTHGRSMLEALKKGTDGRSVLTMEWIVPGEVGGPGGRLLLSARTRAEKYIVTYDVSAATIIEQLFDISDDPGATVDLLKERGVLGTHPVSGSLARGIEEARDLIWASAGGSKALAAAGYVSGGAPPPDDRPPPPTRK